MNKYDLNQASIFERTMSACLEAKRADEANKKKLIESKKNITKKVAKKAASKKVTEAVKKSRKLTEDEDVVDDDPETGMYDDMPVDDPIDNELDDGTMDDAVDDIVVVVDPELDSDDVDDYVDHLQDVVDSTPEGEVPTIDDYVDDFTYTCPICGNTFFSDTEMSSGDACPVCGDSPTDFVLVGSVAPADTEEEAPADDMTNSDDVVDDEAPAEDEPVDDSGEVSDEPAEDDEAEEESLIPATPKKVEKKAVKKSRKFSYRMAENTFNPYLTKFIRENYQNAKSFVVTGATRSRKNGTLSLECKITFASGKTKTFKLESKNFKAAPNGSFTAANNSVFKTESTKIAPFTFSYKIENKTIKCTGMKYNFVTINEGKRVRVYGNLVESKKSFQRGKRK